MKSDKGEAVLDRFLHGAEDAIAGSAAAKQGVELSTIKK
jgi:hypothetical protein